MMNEVCAVHCIQNELINTMLQLKMKKKTTSNGINLASTQFSKI